MPMDVCTCVMNSCSLWVRETHVVECITSSAGRETDAQLKSIINQFFAL